MREATQKRRAAEDAVHELQNKYLLLERRQPEERVVVQEVVVTQKDPKLHEEHSRLSQSLDEEAGRRRQLEREVQQLRAAVQEDEGRLSFQEDRSKKLAVERELRQLTLKLQELEKRPPAVQEKIIMEEVVQLEKDPDLEIKLLTHYSTQEALAIFAWNCGVLCVFPKELNHTLLP